MVLEISLISVRKRLKEDHDLEWQLQDYSNLPLAVMAPKPSASKGGSGSFEPAFKTNFAKPNGRSDDDLESGLPAARASEITENDWDKI